MAKTTKGKTVRKRMTVKAKRKKREGPTPLPFGPYCLKGKKKTKKSTKKGVRKSSR